MPFALIYLMDRQAPSETFIRRELEQLQSRDWPVQTLLLSGGPNRLRFALSGCPAGLRLRFCRAACARLTDELFRSPATALRIIKRLPQAADLVRTAAAAGSPLIHAQFAGITADLAAIAAATLNTAWSCSVHASDIYTAPAALTRRRLRSAAAVAACSRGVAEAVRAAGIPAERIQLIHHGLPLNDFPLCTDRTEEFIFTACRLHRKKGLDTLIRACAILRDRGIATPCVIAGSGPERAALEKLRDALNLNDRITFKGWLSQEEIRSHIRRAALTVLASRRSAEGDRDGIANILIESLALGTPVVTTTAGSAAEIIENGRNGSLAEPDNDLALAEAMAKTLESAELRSRLIKEGRSTVETLFDGAVTIQQLEALFVRAAGANP